MPRRLKAVSPTVDAPLPFESVIFKALAKNPSNRFQSMADMKAALILSQQKTTALNNVLYQLRLSPISKKHLAIGMAIAITSLVASLGVITLISLRRSARLLFPIIQWEMFI